MNTPLQKAAQAVIASITDDEWIEAYEELRKALDAEIAQAVEPDFYTACAEHNGGWIPLPGYSNETVHGVKSRILEDARKEGWKGTIEGRLFALGWQVMPVYLHPPQQATTPMSDFNVRGVLASNLLCWKRLTEAEAQDLVCFFEKVRTAQGEKPQATTPAANWLIRKEPNTKDKYFVAEGNPPEHVLEIYGIAGEKL